MRFNWLKNNKGGSGVDQESIRTLNRIIKETYINFGIDYHLELTFLQLLKGWQYLRNRGGTRMLGIPTEADRIAQMVVKLSFELIVEPKFLENSYGYRPNKSALYAVGVTRKRCFGNIVGA